MEDRKAMLRTKANISIEKNVYKIRNERVAQECGVITNEEFKVKVKKLLDLRLVITIPPMFYKIV
jgi:hypothetical protein